MTTEKQRNETALTHDSWLGRALANMPAPTGKPLEGWERHQPMAKGIWYRLENTERRYGVDGGPRKGWRWWVYAEPNITGRPIAHGFAQHLDFAMLGALQAESLPKVITLSALDTVQYDAKAWEITYSGSLTQGTARILAKHHPAQQTYSMGLLDHPGPGVLAYGAWYIPEASIFYPVKDHLLVRELGQQAIWAYLHHSGQIDDDGQLCVFPYDPDDDHTDTPSPLLQ